MATHYHCVDREQIRLCTCLHSVFDRLRAPSLNMNEEIQPNRSHCLISSSRIARNYYFIVRIRKNSYSIDRCWPVNEQMKNRCLCWFLLCSMDARQTQIFCVSRRIVRFIYKLRIREQTSLTRGWWMESL